MSNDDYRKLDDRDRIFILRYYNWYRYSNISGDEQDQNPLTVTEIRDYIKPFYDEDEFKNISNLEIKKYYDELDFLRPIHKDTDKIVFHDDVMKFMKEVFDEVIEIFLSDKFNKFLYEKEHFDEKRLVTDAIYRIQIKSSRGSIRKYDILDFIIKNFKFMAKLYFEYTAKFVF